VAKLDDASSEAAPLALQLLVALNSAWLDLELSLSADEVKLEPTLTGLGDKTLGREELCSDAPELDELGL